MKGIDPFGKRSLFWEFTDIFEPKIGAPALGTGIKGQLGQYRAGIEASGNLFWRLRNSKSQFGAEYSLRAFAGTGQGQYFVGNEGEVVVVEEFPFGDANVPFRIKGSRPHELFTDFNYGYQQQPFKGPSRIGAEGIIPIPFGTPSPVGIRVGFYLNLTEGEEFLNKLWCSL